VASRSPRIATTSSPFSRRRPNRRSTPAWTSSFYPRHELSTTPIPIEKHFYRSVPSDMMIDVR
jgi:hypothetical protein